jgi:molybdopterin-guanine dinucleotide biosynthesis protein A
VASERGRNIPEPFVSATVIFVLFGALVSENPFSAMNKSSSKRKPVPRPSGSTVQRFSAFSIEICILAGGSSKRMGRDKSRLRLGSTTMVGHIRKAARSAGLPVRVIRRDSIPKCGPLSGIYTALKTTRANAVLFLACDMPCVSTELIQFVLQGFGKSEESRLQPVVGGSHSGGLFVRSQGRAGFPFILPCGAIEIVERQIQIGEYSLQGLAKAVWATILPVTHRLSNQLFNVNAPEDLRIIRENS